MSNYKIVSPVDVKSSSTNGQVNLFSAGSLNAAQIKAPAAALTANVDFTFPTTVGLVGQCIYRSGASSLDWITPGPTNVFFPMSVRLFANSTKGMSTTSATLRTVFQFFYQGSNLVGAPTTAYILFSPSNGNTTLQAQLKNVTPLTTIIANVVAGPFGANTFNLINLGTLSNIPTNTNWISLSIARAAGSGTASVFLFKLMG